MTKPTANSVQMAWGKESNSKTYLSFLHLNVFMVFPQFPGEASMNLSASPCCSVLWIKFRRSLRSQFTQTHLRSEAARKEDASLHLTAAPPVHQLVFAPPLASPFPGTPEECRWSLNHTEPGASVHFFCQTLIERQRIGNEKPHPTGSCRDEPPSSPPTCAGL